MPLFTRQATGLLRELNVLDMYVIAMGNLNAVGGFVICLVLAPAFFPGANFMGVFLIAAIPGLALVAIYSIFSIAMPRAGGDYVWVARTNARLGSIMGIAAILAGAVGGLVYQSYYFVSFGLAQLFFALGVTTSNSSLLSIASTVAQNPWGFIISVVFILVAVIISIFSLRTVKQVNRTLFGLYLATFFIFALALLTLSKGTFVDSFNVAMKPYNVTYATVQAASRNNPSWSTFSLSNTLLAALPVGYFSFYGGFNLSTYLVGETKNVSKSVPGSMALALLSGAVIAVVLSALVGSVLGSDFVSAIANLYANGQFGGLSVQPSINLLVSIATPPWLGFLINLNATIGFFLLALVYMIMYSRVVFAMAFDRLVPTKFANVSERYHSPHVAIITMGVIGVILSALFWYGGFIFAWLNTSFVFPLAYILPAFAALVFPFVRKDIYKSNIEVLHGWLRWKLGPLPLLSIAGLVAVLLFGFDIYCLAFPITAYSYLGSSMVYAGAFVVAVIVGGLVLYEASRSYHKRKDDIDIAMAYKVIPPE